eukprot:g17801.t1
MPPRIERLAADFLEQPVRITVGTAGQAASNVRQHVEVFETEAEKFPWLRARIDGVGRTGRAGAAGEAFTLVSKEMKKGKGDANPRRMAALLVEHLEDVRQTASNKLLSLAMEFQPFKAARAAGLRFDDSMVKGKGKGKGSKGSGDARLVLAIGFHRSTVFAMGLELPPCLIFSLFCLLVPVFMAYNGGATAATVDTIQQEESWSPAGIGFLGAMDKIGMTMAAAFWGRLAAVVFGSGGVASGVGNGLGTIIAGFTTAQGYSYEFAFQIEASVLFVLLLALLATGERSLRYRDEVEPVRIKSPVKRVVRLANESLDEHLVDTASRPNDGERDVMSQLRQLWENPLFCRCAMAYSSANYVNSALQFLWVRVFMEIWNLSKDYCVTSFLIISASSGALGILAASCQKVEHDDSGKLLTLRFVHKAFSGSVLGAFVVLLGVLPQLHQQLHQPEASSLELRSLITTWLGLAMVMVGVTAVPGLLQILCIESVEDAELRSFATGLAQGANNFLGFAMGPMVPQLAMDFLQCHLGWGHEKALASALFTALLGTSMGALSTTLAAFAAKIGAQAWSAHQAEFWPWEKRQSTGHAEALLSISEGREADRHPFEGIGALSAGASEILDLLFKPQYGASLQVLKVEIGGDTQSTDGSEPSHMRYRGETPDCTRGYEAWLLQEAKARNPAIRTYALAWGVPGWIGNGTFFSEELGSQGSYRTVPCILFVDTLQDNIFYHVSWLTCIKERYNIDIDYIGLWNEMPWGDAWYEAQLGTQLVLLDQASGAISTDFLGFFSRDQRFQELVAAVGLHYPCTPDQKLLDTLAAHPRTRFWSSEERLGRNRRQNQATYGAGCWGRMINQNYVRMNATSSIAWSLVWSVYPNLECFGNGLLYANEPWSGHYEVMPPIWTSAHTTQFTKPGWTYLPVGEAAGDLPEHMLDKLQCRCMYHDGCFHTQQPKNTQQLQFQLSENLRAAARGKDLEVWATNGSHWFQRLEAVRMDAEGRLRISLEADAIVTITTLHGATKMGQRESHQIPVSKPFPLPFEEAFETELHRSPAFFSDQGGTFEVVEDGDGIANVRLNQVLQQQVLQAPIGWAGSAPEPLTLFGGTNWTDLDVEVPFGHSAPLSLLQDRHIGLCARVLRYTFFNSGGKPQGYCLQVVDSLKGQEAAKKAAEKGWLRLRLEVYKARISAFVEGAQLASILDTSLPMGQVAFSCGYHKCQFDNLKVLPKAAPVTSFILTSRPLLKLYSPVTFHYDSRTCDPSPSETLKRNDFTGFIGLAFVPKIEIKVAALGRMVLKGGPLLTEVHNVQLLEQDNVTGLRYVASAAVPTTHTQQAISCVETLQR